MWSEKSIKDGIANFEKINSQLSPKSQGPLKAAIVALEQVLEGEPRYSVAELFKIIYTKEFISDTMHWGACESLLEFVRDNPKRVEAVLNGKP